MNCCNKCELRQKEIAERIKKIDGEIDVIKEDIRKNTLSPSFSARGIEAMCQKVTRLVVERAGLELERKHVTMTIE